MKLIKFSQEALSIGGAAVYPYSDLMIEQCNRQTHFGENYSMCRIVGDGDHKRIWVPRNMATAAEKDFRVVGVDFKFNSIFEPRNKEQSRVTHESKVLLDAGKNFMVESPTGSGKTAMAMDIIAHVGKKTLVVVTKEDIRDQWIENIEKILGLSVGAGIGLIQGKLCTHIGQGIVIALIQSIAKESRYPESVFKEFGFAIWDESAAPDTLVTTSIGQLRIQDLVRDKPDCTVWSYNPDSGEWAWKKILAHHEHLPKNPLYRVIHASGFLDFTSEHLMLTQAGWRKVKNLTKDDSLLLDFRYSFQTGNSKGGGAVALYGESGHGFNKFQWCPVLEVIPLKVPTFVYDIEVNDNHTFLANGVVVHNCHRVAADHFSQSCFRVPAKLRMGLSATPDRKDGKVEVMHSHLGPVMVKSEVAPMIPRIIEQRSPWEIPYVNRKNKNGLFNLVQLPHSGGKCMHVIKLVSYHYARNMMLVRFIYSAYKKGRTVLVQSELREHLETLSDLLSHTGVPSGDVAYYVGGMNTSERDYAKGKRIILATYGMTAEATDIPWLDTLVMATPRSDVRQIVGRILREHPNKKPPVVFDIIDATSSVFLGYHRSRHKWYESIGAIVDIIPD